MAAVTTAVFVATGLYRRSWRFLCFADCLFLARTILLGMTAAWAVAIAFLGYRPFGWNAFLLAVLHMSLLAAAMGAMRVARRYARERRLVQTRAADKSEGAAIRHVLLLGPPDWAASVIDLIRADKSSHIDRKRKSLN